MIAALLLVVIPIVVFVLAFLYETYASYRRLTNPSYKRAAYLTATWEVTHTLLVFGVVMLVMLFTQVIDEIATRILIPTFLAATALGVRAVAYIYIFYVRRSRKTNLIDGVFFASHLVAAFFLVVVVVRALWFILDTQPPVNSQFIPYFIPGLVVVLAVCALPALLLYKTKD